jgi:hypothetical protein
VIAPAWMGVDFGTTNSAVAVIDESGAARLVTFPAAGGRRQTFPSVLYFEPRSPSVAGPAAVERYLASETKGRFLQSLKAYLGDRTFEGTAIGTQHYTLEQLIALILWHMSDQPGFSSWPTRDGQRVRRQQLVHRLIAPERVVVGVLQQLAPETDPLEPSAPAEVPGRSRLHEHVVFVVMASPPFHLGLARRFLVVDVVHHLLPECAVVRPVVAHPTVDHRVHRHGYFSAGCGLKRAIRGRNPS